MSGRCLPLAAMALVLLVGCSSMDLRHPVQTTLLEEYKEVSGWSAAETERAVDVLEQRYAESPAGENRLRLALALGFGKGKASDPRRALRLFDEAVSKTDEQTPEQQLLAELLGGVLKDRIQAEAKIGSAEARASAAEAKVSAANRQLESERSRADGLAKKLEALMSIEKSLQKR